MKRLLICLILLLALVLLPSCKEGGEPESSPAPEPSVPEETAPEGAIPDASVVGVEISELTFRYLTASEYNEGDFADELLRGAASFKDGDVCYLVVDMTYHKEKGSVELGKLDVRFEVPSRGVLDMRIEEAATSAITEEKDAGGIYCTLSFSIPDHAEIQKTERIVLRLLAVSGGEADVSVRFGKNANTTLVSEKYTKRIETGESEFSYQIGNDGSYYILKKGNAITAERVEIPEKLKDGVPVTSVGDYAFEGYSDLREIVIPASVSSIGEGAFAGCADLETLVLPAALTWIGSNAFADCTGIVSLEFLGEDFSVGAGAFPAHLTVTYENGIYLGDGDNPYLVLVKVIDKSVTAFEVHANTKILAAAALYDCGAMTSVVLPDALTVVGDRAFRGCAALAAVTLPDTVCKMGDEVFKGCASLTSIKIPDLVQYIGASAFQECTALASVTLPASLLRIESTAFAACWALHTLTLPVSLQFVGQYAFAGCGALSVLTYEGTTTQWNALYKHDLWQGSAVIATVVCSDGTVTL